MHIEVKSKEVEIKKGVGRSGRPYEILEQSALLFNGDEIRKIVVTLRHGQSPYALGRYGISNESFEVDRFGGLQIGRLVLQPLTPSAMKATV